MTRWNTAVVCVLIAGIVRADGEAKTVSIEAVKIAWQERQDKLKSFRIEWTETQHLPAGVLSHLWRQVATGPRLKVINPDGDTVPPQDAKFVVKGKIECQSGRVALRLGRSAWHHKKKVFVPAPLQVVFDGKIQRRLLPNGSGETDWPQATVAKRKVFNWAHGPHCRPVFAYARGNDPAYTAYLLDEFSVTGRQSTIDGVSCVELQRKARDVVSRLWVAPDRNYVLIRGAIVRGPEVLQQITITYQPNKVLGWELTGWQTTTSHNKGQLVERYVGVVDSASWNEAVPTQAFDLSFPYGTRVVDDTRPRKEQHYIVRGDSEKRIITSGELGKPYRELLSSDPSPTVEAKRHWISMTISLFSVAAIVMMCVLVCRSWLRLRKKTLGGDSRNEN